MKAKLKKWLNDIKCGFREDNRNCMRYKAYGVFVSLLGVLMSFIIAFSAFWCGRNSAASKSNVVTASAEEVSTAETTESNTYEFSLTPYEFTIYYTNTSDCVMSCNQFLLTLSVDGVSIYSYGNDYFLPWVYNSEVVIRSYISFLSNVNPVYEGEKYYVGINSLSSIDIATIFTDYVFKNYKVTFSDSRHLFSSCRFWFVDKETLTNEAHLEIYFNYHPSYTVSRVFNSSMYYNSLSYSSYPMDNYWKYYYLANPEYAGAIYDEGYDEGYSLGLERGKDVGYDEGYQDGLSKAERGTFANAVSTVLGAPVTVVSQFLDFDILGFNMLAFVAGLITLMIIIKLLRIFI